MKKRIVTYIYAFLLTASLIAADALPAFAAELPGKRISDDGQVLEENFSDPGAADNIAETPGENDSEPEPEIPDDGLIRVDDTLYSGYYMDSAGVFCLVTEGVTKPFYGIVNAGTSYYHCDAANVMTQMTLPKQTMFIAGKAHTGYYMDNSGVLYAVTAGTMAPANGAISKGTAYFCYNASGAMTSMCLSQQTVFVNGRVYSGYYMDSSGTLYSVAAGTPEPANGAINKGTSYFSYNASGIMTSMSLPKQTVFVNGKVYSGYYMNNKNKMCRVKNGTSALKTGALKKGTKYFNYKSKKTKKLSKKTLYVNGKAYTGYYLNNKNKMYRVNKGTAVLATGLIGQGTRYYNYKEKKTQTLSLETLYVEGTVYNGYYLGSDNKMYLLSNGTYTPVNTLLNAGTAYYSCAENRLLALPEAKVYVYGKAVESLTPAGVVTFQKAQNVVQAITSPTDSPADKLYKCYLWMEKFPYIQYRTMAEGLNIDPENWDVIFANDIFDTNAGCCVSGSCAFAYMAKACGFEKVTICSDTEHAWVDIDGRLYDPLFAKDRNFSANYNAAYTDYRIHAAITREL